jgi:hypothetical protein
LFADLAVDGGEKKFENIEGKKWDMGLPAMFRFEFVREEGSKHEGIKLMRSQIFSDTGPVIMEMLKKGMAKPESLVKYI